MTGHAEVTLVTGSAGFLGQAVLRLLRMETGHRLVASVRQPVGLPSDVTGCVADLATPAASDPLRAALGDAESVRLVHLAGGYPAGSSEVVTSSNVESTLVLLEALGDRLVQVVHASSVAVYGNHRQRRDGRGFEVAPDTDYGRAKWLAEAALVLFARRTEVPVVSLRLASLYGAGNTGRNAVAALTSAVANGRPFVVSPAGPVHARDYLHVDDAARAVVGALGTVADGALDIGSGTASSPYDLVDALRASGVAVTVQDPDGVPVKTAGSLASRFACDLSQMRAALDLPSPRSLTDGLTEELGWRKENACGGGEPGA
jgi:nucleoside-diphosphate-sugar epimerase